MSDMSEIERLRAENERLTKLVAELTDELEDYRRAAQAWAMAELTDEEIKSYGKQEHGLTLEEFIGDLERRARGQQGS